MTRNNNFSSTQTQSTKVEIGQNIVKNEIRHDLEMIAKLIKPNSKVIDIGCGNGELLKFLKKEKNIDARGLEISQELVGEAVKEGISVIQGDAENDLEFYPDSSFDFAILSQTLQATKNPKKILQEMLRIADFAVISLPNFAHYKNRFHLLLKGTMPINETIPFQWYETPNIHFCSLKDFENLCRELNFSVKSKFFLTSKSGLFERFFGHKVLEFLGQNSIVNFFAEYGVYLITKDDLCLTNQEEFIFKNSSRTSFQPRPKAAFLSTK